ncbi:MAG TPA: ABC transporter permease [Terracidiphilus sp.]
MSLKRFFHRRRRDADLAAEIEAHLALEADENQSLGLSAQEARRRAYIKFGSPRRVRESEWEHNTMKHIDDTVRDFRYALRTLVRTPGFTIAAILVMALGIGANTALFTVVRSVLLKPLPFTQPDRLIQLYEQSPNGKRVYSWVAPGMYAAWKSQATSVEQMAVFGTDSISLSGDGGPLPERIRYAECEWNLFSMLGVQPILGRSFVQSDDRPNAPGTVILTHSMWMRRYAGDKSILGKTILLDARPYTVIGVLPAWFVYPDAPTQMWAAIYHEKSPAQMSQIDNHNYMVIARLRPGATMAQALSEVDTAEKRVHLSSHNPFVGNAASARTLLDGLVHDAKTQLYVLLGATCCVLLIACLNVANLLVARSASRRKETSIRAALGGSRLRLLREQVTESIALSFAGGVVGLPLAWAAVRWLVESRPDMARASSIHMDLGSILFGLGIIAFSGVLAGLIPAASLLRSPLLDALQDSSRANSAGQGRARLRRILLAAEVGLTVVLLIGAGLLLKSYQHLRSSDIGCATQNVLTMGFSLPGARYDTAQKVAGFYEQLLPRLRALPGIKVAGISTALPGQGYGGDSRFSIPEHPAPPPGTQFDAMVRGVDPGYFSAIGIPLVRGRSFNESERLDRALSVIVSESFARQFFPGEDPIGKHIKALDFQGVPPQGFEVVGVVGNTLWGLTEDEAPIMYFPLYSGGWPGASIAVRSDLDVTSFAAPIEKLIAQIDPDLPVANVLTMDQALGKSTLDASFTSTLVLAFAVIALVLAAVGLYGVLAYLAAQRTSEIGIRLALGARRNSVLRLMLFDGLRPAAAGLAIGLAAGAFSVRLIRTLLYGVNPLDWTVFAVVTVVLSLVAALACALPAWRASRLNPMQALRTD